MPKDKTAKPILAVKIIKLIDDRPDTSHLGEYSNHATSKFSIDRRHAEDCQFNSDVAKQAIEKLERVIGHLDAVRISPEVANNPDSTEWEGLDIAIDTITDLQRELEDCDCGGHCVSSRELPYFNPSFNYIGEDGKLADGLTPEDVRKYIRQDYDRMESLNNGSWCYLGIRAEAEVLTNQKALSTIQRITSGGLYGVESDSDHEYLKSVGNEELESLKSELREFGFSTRAISKAFESIDEVNQ